MLSVVIFAYTVSKLSKLRSRGSVKQKTLGWLWYTGHICIQNCMKNGIRFLLSQ